MKAEGVTDPCGGPVVLVLDQALPRSNLTGIQLPHRACLLRQVEQVRDQAAHARALSFLGGRKPVVLVQIIHQRLRTGVIIGLHAQQRLGVASGHGGHLLPHPAQAVVLHPGAIAHGVDIEQFVGGFGHARVVVAQLRLQGAAVGARVPTRCDARDEVSGQRVDRLMLCPTEKTFFLRGIGIGDADLRLDGIGHAGLVHQVHQGLGAQVRALAQQVIAQVPDVLWPGAHDLFHHGVRIATVDQGLVQVARVAVIRAGAHHHTGHAHHAGVHTDQVRRAFAAHAPGDACGQQQVADMLGEEARARAVVVGDGVVGVHVEVPLLRFAAPAIEGVVSATARRSLDGADGVVWCIQLTIDFPAVQVGRDVAVLVAVMLQADGGGVAAGLGAGADALAHEAGASNARCCC